MTQLGLVVEHECGERVAGILLLRRWPPDAHTLYKGRDPRSYDVALDATGEWRRTKLSIGWVRPSSRTDQRAVNPTSIWS